jgi:peptide deformylase
MTTYARTILIEDPRLQRKSAKVKPKELRSPLFQQLIDDMVLTRHNSGGVGLSAVQVGVMKRLCVIGDPSMNIALINPILELGEEREWLEEGCLSKPGFRCEMYRPKQVVVTALNRQGKKTRLSFTGVAAQCVCHELDHFNGMVLWTNRLDRRNPKLLNADGSVKLHLPAW